MAIFSRRDLQAAVNSLSDKLSREQLSDLVQRLNGKPAGSLAAEWEVVLQAAFANCGRVQHGMNFGGPTRPDLFFQLGASGLLEFVADIRTVSDVNTHAENPNEEFTSAIRRFLVKRGHTSAGINVQVGHREEGKYGDRKVKLQLPERKDIDGFVKRELGGLLTKIAREPDKDMKFHYDRDGIRFSIQYNSKEKQSSGGGHIGYTVPYSKERNPLTHALDKKRKQLADSGYGGPKAIIICDGGCDALQERAQINSAFGCQQIVERFLRAHKSILFVLVLQIEQRMQGFMGRFSTAICPKLYWNPVRENDLYQETSVAIKRALAFLPSPEATPRSAMYWLNGQNKHVGRPNGGYTMQSNTIKLSARSLTELLAGKINQKQFLEEHGLEPKQMNQITFSFFKMQLQQGNTLQNAFVEHDHHKDDDWIVLEFAGPDPAISPFRVPN